MIKAQTLTLFEVSKNLSAISGGTIIPKVSVGERTTLTPTFRIKIKNFIHFFFLSNLVYVCTYNKSLHEYCPIFIPPTSKCF